EAVETAVGQHVGDGRLSWLLLTGGRRTVNKVVAFPVPDATGRPELVVKFARTDAEEESLRREDSVLRGLDVAGVPRALFLERRAGCLALGETALDGDPLIWGLDASTFDGLAASVTDWLADL